MNATGTYFINKTYDATGQLLRVRYQFGTAGTGPLGSIGDSFPDGGNEPQGGGLVGPIQPPVFDDGRKDYCGNIIYENNALSQILFDGGYITLSGTTPTYHYYLQDYLGNNRVVVKQDGTVEQVNHYYPFGGIIADICSDQDIQPYKYNGKELDLMHGLNTYDYGARQYFSILGRWDRMDPLCEKYYSLSPYNYCGNNPIRFVDPDGKWKWDVNGNLLSEERDNEYTLSNFLNTNLYNATVLLSTYRILHNDCNEYLEGGIVLNKDNLYIIECDYDAPVVNNTKEAVIHYYLGNGEPADVGNESTAELMSSPKFKQKHNEIATTDEVEGGFVVDMTKKTFHIGKTNVVYYVNRGNQSSSVTYTLFANDGFRDPFDIGIEACGTPYDYKTRKVTYFFKPIKGYKKRK